MTWPVEKFVLKLDLHFSNNELESRYKILFGLGELVSQADAVLSKGGKEKKLKQCRA